MILNFVSESSDPNREKDEERSCKCWKEVINLQIFLPKEKIKDIKNIYLIH
jgi:hypothetical protein